MDLTELFGDGQLIPRDPFLPYGQQGYVILPQPILNFISEVFVELEGQNEQNRNKYWRCCLFFIRTIDHRSGAAEVLSQHGRQSRDNSDVQRKVNAVLSVNEKNWLHAIYAICVGMVEISD